MRGSPLGYVLIPAAILYATAAAAARANAAANATRSTLERFIESSLRGGDRQIGQSASCVWRFYFKYDSGGR